MPNLLPPRLPVLAVVLSVVLAACGGDGPIGPVEGPEITITGIQAGTTYESAVTVHINVPTGSTFQAFLNGSSFTSGTTISTPGQYMLLVEAKRGTATSQKTVEFAIQYAGDAVLIVRMINLGATGAPGDAILVTDSSAAGLFHAMIDAGPHVSGPEYVGQWLQTRGVNRLEYLQITHAHSDHYGGVGGVMQRMSAGVLRFVYSGQVRTLPSYNNAVSAASAADSTIIVGANAQPHVFTLGSGTRFETIPPLATWLNDANANGTQLNEGSLGTYVSLGDSRLFFTGDAEHQANARFRTQFPQQTANLTMLKVGHHGANNAIFDSGISGASTWLTHTNPKLALISANGTSHPRVNALNALHARAQTETYCTNVHGDIAVRFDNAGNYWVVAERNENMNCVPGSAANT